jgi:hypothetical protein
MLSGIYFWIISVRHQISHGVPGPPQLWHRGLRLLQTWQCNPSCRSHLQRSSCIVLTSSVSTILTVCPNILMARAFSFVLSRSIAVTARHRSQCRTRALLPTFGAGVVDSVFMAFSPPLRSAELVRSDYRTHHVPASLPCIASQARIPRLHRVRQRWDQRLQRAHPIRAQAFRKSKSEQDDGEERYGLRCWFVFS